MKRKTFGLLLAAGLSFLPAVLRSQDKTDSPETAQIKTEEAKRADNATVQKAEADQQWYENELHRAQDLAAKQQAEAADEYKRANPMFQDRLRAVINRGPGSPGQSLVIRSSEFDPKEQANLEEDLAVMSHLLEKTVGSLGTPPQGRSVLGVNLVFAPGHSPVRGLYLEGYGALFSLNVGFPLLPSPKNEDEKESPTTDSAWNEARQEVYGQQRFDGKAVYVRGEEYDEGKVNRLKDAVLEGLKNATHVRGLKNDDSVTVCVFGGGAALPVKIISGKPDGSKPKEVYVADRPQSRSTMLTIRVKKSDVDSFAKDKLNLDDFRKRAKIMPYAGGPDSAMGAGFVGGGGGSYGGGNTFGGAGGY